MRRVHATVSLQEALERSLSELREQFLQRLISAGADPRDAERLMSNAIGELERSERPRVSLPDFQRRFLKEVDRQCQIFADLRRLPYGRLAPVVSWHWRTLLELARKAGIGRQDAFCVLRDMLWKHGASWAASKNPEVELLADLEYGFNVVGLTRRGFRIFGEHNRQAAAEALSPLRGAL